ncbi:uncharacterized protein THITE_2060019, partial [Thermothielavioides terrestris NRRL 8126]
EPPPPPPISSEGIVAVDVTQKFLAAASCLEPGELVKDGYFTLFASVGALEVMDPKMDSGCLAPGESLDDDYDVSRPLLPSEVIGIIDQLLSLEVGGEEDFVTNTYHRSLLDGFSLSEICDEIEAARGVVHDLRATLTEEMADAICLRLELRTAFLRTFELSPLKSTADLLSKPWSDMQRIWESIKKTRHLGKPVPAAFSTRIQRRLASTLPPRPMVQPSPEQTDEHFEKFIAHGMNAPKVLEYTSPQSLLNFVLTFQSQKPQPLPYIRALLQHFVFGDMVVVGRLSIRQVLDEDLSIVVLPSSILLDRANDEVEAPNHPRYVIAQQMELFRQRAAQSYLDLFRALSQNRCRVRRTLYHMLQDWETLQVDAEHIDQLLQAYTEEKPIVYPPSGAAPTHSLPLSSWTYHYKLRLMEWTVQLGFELEIYQPDELAGMYWYLGHLARTRDQHTERIRFFTAQRIKAAGPGAIDAAAAAQFARSRAYLHLTTLDAAATAEMADALSNLYTALRRLLVGGGALAPPPRPYSTDALRYEVRMRPFAPVGLPALPTFATFSRAVARPDTPTAALLERAARGAAAARRALQAMSALSAADAFAEACHARWLAGIRDWTRAAVALAVAVTTVQRAVADRREAGLSVLVPPPAERYHDWWVVPKVVVEK